MQVLLLLALAAVQEPEDRKVDLVKTKLFFFDASRGITLRVHDDGRVELAVKEKDGGARKTYKARSAEAFRKAYPDTILRYDLGRFLGAGVARQDFNDWWKRQRNRFPQLGRPWDEEWKKWAEDQERLMEELRRRFRPGAPAPVPPPHPRSREFGVKVEEPEETLRAQLSLGEDEGVLVTFVKPESAAEKAGVRRFDLFVALDGKKITDKWSFRKDVLEALSKPEFELEAIRGGKKTSIRVKGSGNK